jgi:hypothetical protein
MLGVGPAETNLVATGLSGMTVEVAVVAAAVLLLVVLLVLRAKRARGQRLRLGAATGYFDREAARYAHSSGGSGPGSAPVALAPSFTSVPKRMGRRGSAPPGASTPVPQPVPSFAVPDGGHLGAVPVLGASGAVPAFDRAGPVPARTLPTLPPPPPGRPTATQPTGSALSTLPTLEQPPPPPLREAPPA